MRQKFSTLIQFLRLLEMPKPLETIIPLDLESSSRFILTANVKLSAVTSATISWKEPEWSTKMIRFVLAMFKN